MVTELKIGGPALTADGTVGAPLTVSEILAHRARDGRPPATLSAGLSILAHAAFVVAVILTSRPRHVPVAIPISLPGPRRLAPRPSDARRPRPRRSRPRPPPSLFPSRPGPGP